MTGVQTCALPIYRSNFYSDVRNEFEKFFNTDELAEFQTLEMTIVGDPCYLVDEIFNDVSKFFELAKNRQNGTVLLSNGLVDWSQDVLIGLKVNRDSGKRGLSKLMSRLYRVIQIKHVFNNGKFTQDIEAVFVPPVPDKEQKKEEKKEPETVESPPASDPQEDYVTLEKTTTETTRIYIVKPGDTLSEIAEANQTKIGRAHV